MTDSALSQQLKVLALCGAGLVLAIFIGSQIGHENYGPLLLGAVIIVVACIALFTGRFFWVLTIASSFLTGTFPILGGAFTPFQILMAIALAAFFIVQSIPMSSRMWAKLPYVVLAVTGFDLLIAVITTISPKSIYIIYPFYSAVSSSGLQEIITGSTLDVTGRIGTFGSFGFVLILIVLASVRLTEIFNPKHFFQAVCLFVGVITTLFSGFRSAVINGLIGFLI